MRNIKILNASGAFVWMFMYVYTPIFSVYVRSMGISAAVLGIISGSYGVTQILLKIPLGMLLDRTKNDRLVLCVGFSLATLSNLIFVVQDGDAAMLLIARCLAGAGASWWLVVSVLYAKYHSIDEQVKAQGRLASISNLGKIGGCVLCTVIAQYLGYKATFIAALGVSAAALGVSSGMRNIREVKPEKKASLKDCLLILKNKELVFLSILAIIGQLAYFGQVMTFNPVVAGDLGADSLMLGIMSTLAFAAMTMGSAVVGSKLYRRLGGINVTALGFALGALGSVPLFLNTSLIVVFIMQMLGGACYGITQAALAGFVMRCVPSEQRGMASGIFQSIWGVGVLLGPVIMGQAIDNLSLAASYWIVFGLVAAAIILCYLLIPRKYDTMK